MKHTGFVAALLTLTSLIGANGLPATFAWLGANFAGREDNVFGYEGTDWNLSGFWYSLSHGESEVLVPSEVTEYIDYPLYPMLYLIEYCGGIKGTINIKTSAAVESYAGYAFDVNAAEGSYDSYTDSYEMVILSDDITVWGGLCLELKSEKDFTLRIFPDSTKITDGTTFQATVPASNGETSIDIPWDQFQCSAGPNCTHTAEDFLQNASIVFVGISDTTNSSTEFFLTKFGSLGQCGDSSQTIHNHLSVKDFQGPAKATIMNTRGEVVTSMDVKDFNSIDLSQLKSGTYIIRITGKNGSFNLIRTHKATLTMSFRKALQGFDFFFRKFCQRRNSV